MDKITRYLILLFICVIFFALAPLIVVYVSGRGFSLGSSDNGTAILDIQSKPSSSQIFLDGKLTTTTPHTIRFIKQGTYNIEIKKEGYRNWSKNLFLEAGKVTYAGNLNDAIKLLPDSPAVSLSDTTVKTFLQFNNQVVFIDQNNMISLYDLSEKKIIKQAKLATSISKLNLTLDENFALAQSDDNKLFLLDLQSFTLSSLPVQFVPSQNIALVSKNFLFTEQGSNLISYNLTTKGVAKTVLSNIQAFTVNGDTLYIAKAGINGLQTYFWDGATLTPQDILYAGAIPQGKSSKLFLTDHKELFLQVDSALYRINAEPELVNNQVETVNFNPARQELTFTTPTEIYFYNFSSAQTELFHRTSLPVSNAVVVPELGYGFFTTNNELTATELDNRNGQNQYSLLKSGIIYDFQLTDNENQLVILADGKLYSIVVN